MYSTMAAPRTTTAAHDDRADSHKRVCFADGHLSDEPSQYYIRSLSSTTGAAGTERTFPLVDNPAVVKSTLPTRFCPLSLSSPVGAAAPMTMLAIQATNDTGAVEPGLLADTRSSMGIRPAMPSRSDRYDGDNSTAAPKGSQEGLDVPTPKSPIHPDERAVSPDHPMLGLQQNTKPFTDDASAPSIPLAAVFSKNSLQLANTIALEKTSTHPTSFLPAASNLHGRISEKSLVMVPYAGALPVSDPNGTKECSSSVRSLGTTAMAEGVYSHNELDEFPNYGGKHAQQLKLAGSSSTCLHPNVFSDSGRGLWIASENGIRSMLSEEEGGASVTVAGLGKSFSGGPTVRGRRQRTQWVVISAEQAEQAARRLRLETEKTKVLESTVQKHKRERIKIFDAAMKQATKREEEGINEAKQSLQREQNTMRAEVDQELQKINDLYDKRCRDYAHMVSEECDSEESKAVAGLRNDWARHKKTIAQLVRDGGREDRQVAVIAKAVVEQLAEEKKGEIDAIRTEIYADVKGEFEAREVAMKAALQSDFQVDLEGQLLLAEIQHQKDIDRLKTELSGGDAAAPDAASAASVTVHRRVKITEVGGGGTGATVPPSTPLPSFPKRPLQDRTRVGVKVEENNREGVAGRGGGGSTEGRRGLIGKLPAFKMPVQKNSPCNDKAKTNSLSIGTKPPPQPPARIKISRLSTIGRRSTCAVEDSAVEDISRTEKQVGKQNDLIEGITGALVVSPTKSIPGVGNVTPSAEESSRSASLEECARPNKRAKRLSSLFSS